MRVEFLDSLGADDAAACNKKTGSSLNAKECVKGASVDIPESAADWIGKKYKALIAVKEDAKPVLKAIAKAPEVKGEK